MRKSASVPFKHIAFNQHLLHGRLIHHCLKNMMG